MAAFRNLTELQTLEVDSLNNSAETERAIWAAIRTAHPTLEEQAAALLERSAALLEESKALMRKAQELAAEAQRLAKAAAELVRRAELKRLGD